MADPWADFRIQTPAAPAAPQAPAAAPTQTVDPWAEFKSPGITMGDVGNAANTVVNTIGTGIIKGTTGVLGMPRAAGDAAISTLDWLGVPKSVTTLLQAQNPTRFLPTSEDMNRAIFSKPTLSSLITGETSTSPWAIPEVNAGDNPNLTFKPPILGGGSVNVGKMIDAGIQAVPSMLIAAPAAVGGAVRQGLTTAIPGFVSGVGGEAAGQAAEGAGAPAWAQTGARILGSGLGYVAGNRVISPNPSVLTPEQARSVETARANDVPMTVYQETGRGRMLQNAINRSFGGAGPFDALRDKQAQAVQGSMLENIGVTGLNRTDPIAMAEVNAAKNAEFNAAKNTSRPVTLDNQFYKDLAGHVQNYVDNTNASTRIPSVAKRAQDFLDRAAAPNTSPNGPTVTGPEYQALRSNVGTASYNATNPQAKFALKGIRTALDDAMVRSVPPDEAAAFQQARANWAGLKAVEKAAAGGTVGARTEGNISPSALASALKQGQGAGVFAQKVGGLNDIARMSAYLADKVPNSGTAETLNAQNLLRTAFAPSAGTGIGAIIGGPVGGLVGTGLSLGGTNLLARALTGEFGGGLLHRYLVNQSAQSLNPALIGALVGGSQAAGQPSGRR